MKKIGCGILFYNKKEKKVLLFKRDNKKEIPYPGYLDILGGHVEDNEKPAEAIAREMSEELFVKRVNAPYVLNDFNLFLNYFDKDLNIEQYIFSKEIDFDIKDVDLLEGQKLVWMNLDEVRENKLAYNFNNIVEEFLLSI